MANGRSNPRIKRAVRPAPDNDFRIEREKIRHRHPDDMRHLEEDDDYFTDDDQVDEYGLEDGADEQASWSDEGPWPEEEEHVPAEEQEGWDNDDDEEWVFDEAGTEAAEDDRGGVVWDDGDDIEFGGGQGKTYVNRPDGPEVELAGLRDTRPRQRNSGGPPPDDEHAVPPRSDQRRDMRGGRARPPLDADLGEFHIERAPPPPRHGDPQARRVGRKSSTMLQMDDDDLATSPRRMGAGAAMPHRVPPSRIQPPPSRKSSFARPAKGLPIPFGKIAAVTAVFVSGWVLYQVISAPGGSEVVARFAESLGLASASRTAEDTSFGAPSEPAAGVPPEEAIASLPQATDNNSILEAFSPQPPPALADGRPANGNYPPFPKFKPRNAAGQPDVQASTRGFGTSSDNGSSPSILDSILRYFESG